jgi:hypothetical protein
MRVLSRLAFQALRETPLLLPQVARARDSVPKQFCSLFFYFIKCGAESPTNSRDVMTLVFFQNLGKCL